MTRQCTLLGGEEPARFPLTVLSCVVLIGRFFSPAFDSTHGVHSQLQGTVNIAGESCTMLSYVLIVSEPLSGWGWYYLSIISIYHGLPWWLSGKASTCQCRRSRFDPWVRKILLQEEMASHSRILAWEIPWTEKPGGLQSMALKKSQMWLSN